MTGSGNRVAQGARVQVFMRVGNLDEIIVGRITLDIDDDGCVVPLKGRDIADLLRSAADEFERQDA